MAKLRLGIIESDKPVKLTIELPAVVHRDLVAYAEAHARETGQPALAPEKLMAPMLERFMASDRGFSRARRRSKPSHQPSGA
ncbi:MAG: hypothetical protein BGO51_12835 [Rhodospirillales bacterium 69-11]|nr:MAG: hypothetical protein BGO51_12835 [Rhodospirillales bacterium 69-11]